MSIALAKTNTKSSTHSLSIVIPVYNSENSLEQLVSHLETTLSEISPIYEVILVNDGSLDQSWNKISEICQRNPNIIGINLMRNYGQHNAILCGVRAAKHEVTVTMDDDLQHPAEEINKLLAALDDGYDVVYGTPQKQQHSLWRNLASFLIRLALQGTMGVENARKVSAYRAFRTQLRDAFANYRSPFVILDALLSWGTNRFTVIQVQHKPRKQGKSQYSFRSLVNLSINLVTGFSILPLQMASFMGFAFAIFGLAVLIYVIGRYLILGGSVPGFPFIASTIAIFSGVQLFALGIIGEYLARMHFRLMEKPTYIIRDQIHPADKENEDNEF